MYRVQWRVTEQLHTHTHTVCCIQSLCIMHSTLACCHPAWSQLGEQSNWQPTRGDDSSDPRNRDGAHNGGCLPTDHWFRCQDLTSWSAAGHLMHIHSILKQHCSTGITHPHQVISSISSAQLFSNTSHYNTSVYPCVSFPSMV